MFKMNASRAAVKTSFYFQHVMSVLVWLQGADEDNMEEHEEDEFERQRN